MSDDFSIQSHIGPYHVHFVADAPVVANDLVSDSVHFIVDRQVAEIYKARLPEVLAAPSLLLIDADETTKSLERMPDYVAKLASGGFRRNHRLIAIGGGVTQDITCFLSATMMRGVDWIFFPTTLLAQADSCIGSKSSINSGAFKNILGTFTPPREIYIDVGFLDTLNEEDVRSGVGEILKVHAIDHADSFRKISADYARVFLEKSVMVEYVRRSLLIKKPYIEIDEYDRESRQIFNYGHTFGHAIESATEFAIPHGLAVTMGMDVANFLAWRLGYAERRIFDQAHSTLQKNYRGYESLQVPQTRFHAALSYDKKNTSQGSVTCILPDNDGKLARHAVPADAKFHAACSDYFDQARSS